ncbi:glycogen debranching enzyme N-terminal domain-containing protein [Flexithrix dorotheae]|uniref:glycogen debranching enzyme N-terminal domain-containing protein n=1 Tax=Flexithrix dorotheae TaxID=70993 RepID=UPI0003718CBE|nr:glycogen debranching enzyme N-terminal domain-containing protein [Flexithrix dorotheae]
MLLNRFQPNTFSSPNFKILSSQEWLESNGIGAYASSTSCGVNTRKAHGLFVVPGNHAPLSDPPYVVLSKFDEQVVTQNNKLSLTTNQYPNRLFPEGYKRIENIRTDLYPEFTFHLDEIRIKKSIAFIHERNSLVIIYEVLNSPTPFLLELKPLVANRDCTRLHFHNDSICESGKFESGNFYYKAYPNNPELFISIPGSEFNFNSTWYYSHELLRELELGNDFKEDLFSPGHFSVSLKEGQKLGIIISSEKENDDALKLFEKEIQRREKYISKKSTKIFQKLQISAEQFFIHQNEKLFVRDKFFKFDSIDSPYSLIGLPGLILATGRFSHFRALLKKSFEQMENKPDSPEYFKLLSIYLTSCVKYLQYTENLSFLEKKLQPVLGTLHQLLKSIEIFSEPFFDVKEANLNRIISAFNSLKLSSFFQKLFNKEEYAEYSNKLAEKLKEGFNKQKYNTGLKKESSLKKQLFAMSLPYPIHSKASGISLLDNIESYLIPGIEKNISSNNLIGEIKTLEMTAFIEGLIKFKRNEGLIKGKFIFQHLMNHLIRNGKRTITESMDFSNPFKAENGVIMDCNSTGEILRIGIEYGLFSNYFPEIPVLKNNINDNWFQKSKNESSENPEEKKSNPFSIISAFRDHASSQRLYRLLSVFGLS